MVFEKRILYRIEELERKREDDFKYLNQRIDQLRQEMSQFRQEMSRINHRIDTVIQMLSDILRK